MCIASNAPITAMNDTALIRKQYPVPTATMSTPATAGPTMRARLNSIELRPTAFGTYSGGTSSGASDARAGLSNACPNPKKNVIT